MDTKYLVWALVIGVGALLGAFLRLAVVMWLVFVLVAVAFVGGFAAAYLQIIQAEYFLLLMGVLPVAGVLFAAAAVSNALVGPSMKSATKSSRSSVKG